jgi:hypothetical protein
MLSLRDSGKVVGNPVSVRQLAQQCNLPLSLSLDQFINAQGCPFPQLLRLHIKILTDPNIAIETMLENMRVVYATAGIRVELASLESLTGTAFTNLIDLDVGQCVAGNTTTEQNTLFQNRNSVGTNEVVVYFVRTTVPALNGCAAHPNGQPGAVVTRNASQWTLAHEVGHVLGLNHISGEHQGCPSTDPECCGSADFTRLMTGCSTSNITGTPTISQGEINTLIASNLTNPG